NRGRHRAHASRGGTQNSEHRWRAFAIEAADPHAPLGSRHDDLENLSSTRARRIELDGVTSVLLQHGLLHLCAYSDDVLSCALRQGRLVYSAVRTRQL